MTFRKDPFLCPDVQKISNFCLDVQINVSASGRSILCERFTIGPILHKNAIKLENIRCRGGGVGAEGADNFFDYLSTKY